MRDRFDKRGWGRFVPPAKGSGTIRPNLETGPRHQQNCTDCHKENARPVRSEPQESPASRCRLQSVANRPGGIRAAKGSPPNRGAHHVQDTAENEQRAKPNQEHSRPSIHRCHAQQNGDSSRRHPIRSVVATPGAEMPGGKKGRYAPPMHMIKLTETREI